MIGMIYPLAGHDVQKRWFLYLTSCPGFSGRRKGQYPTIENEME